MSESSFVRWLTYELYHNRCRWQSVGESPVAPDREEHLQWVAHSVACLMDAGCYSTFEEVLVSEDFDITDEERHALQFHWALWRRQWQEEKNRETAD